MKITRRTSIWVTLLLTVWTQIPVMAYPGQITTVAGRGIGDGGPAIKARLGAPSDIALGPDGDLYIAETYRNRIRRVDAETGVISTLIGDGNYNALVEPLWANGEGGPANRARISEPVAIATDLVGNVYFAENLDFRVRKISPEGILSTVAGNGIPGIPVEGTPASLTSLTSPSGIATDRLGNLFISDRTIGRVYKVDTSGTIRTVAGRGAGNCGIDNSGLANTRFDGFPAVVADLCVPSGIAVADDGSFFIAEGGTGRIRKVSADGVISTVAGNGRWGYAGDGGQATSAELASPRRVSIDTGGNLLIADVFNDRVRKVDANGVISTVAGNGSYKLADGVPATNSALDGPYSVIAGADGGFYIADFYHLRVRRVDASGIITTVAGGGPDRHSGDGGLATRADLFYPTGVAATATGFYIADAGNDRIRFVDQSGVITTVAGSGAYGFSGDGGPAINAQLYGPFDTFATKNGELLIADTGNHRIRRIDQSGIITTVVGNGVKGFSGDGGSALSASLFAPTDVFVDESGSMYISDYGNNRIRKVDATGMISTIAGTGVAGYSGNGGPATAARLHSPASVTVAPDGTVYFTDRMNEAVRRISPDGTIETIAGTGPDEGGGYFDGNIATQTWLGETWGIEIDQSGHVVATSLSHGSVFRIIDGRIQIVAGGGYDYGFGGDEGPATEAGLWAPAGLSFDDGGNLFIAENGNLSIRRIETPF